jgi:hypothetical protein
MATEYLTGTVFTGGAPPLKFGAGALARPASTAPSSASAACPRAGRDQNIFSRTRPSACTPARQSASDADS